MDTELGELLTRCTIRAAVACYLGRVLLDVRFLRPGSRRMPSMIYRLARWLWSAAGALAVVHVVLAMGVFHGWSHEAAYRHTARETAAVTGLAWGGGLYVNYAFVALWMADIAAWWLRGPTFPYRRRAFFWTVQIVFAFIMLNATVVFGPPLWRWVAAGAAAALVLARFAGPRDRRG